MQATSVSPAILERVVTILRRDLKLGPDVAIPPDMPFFGSDVDLDSLDILLLVTSVEKEFGVKIPSDKVGKEVFENVSTLVNYIEQNAGVAGANGAAAASVSTTPIDALKQLPHGPEFRFVSRVVELQPGHSATGIWEVTGTEDFFKGHFPNNPLVPGVLIAEALAQISGIAGAGSGGGMIAQIDVRFSKPVKPPAQIKLSAKVARVLGELAQFDVSASVADDVVASGMITLHRPK